MKKIIFVRIADMEYYNGITDTDKPKNGGSYIAETGDAHECYNFAPFTYYEEPEKKCVGFFMLTGGQGATQLHIEKICGCELLKKEESVEGVYVVFVSKAEGAKNMNIVGFYKNAIAYRYPQYLLFDNDYEQEFQFEALAKDCVLIPKNKRNWVVPASSSKYNTYGFGRSNVWYAGGKGASDNEIKYVENTIKFIENYQGENLVEGNEG